MLPVLGGVIMKRYQLLGLGLLVLAACASNDGERELQFSVLTYNVAGLPAGISSSEPDINTSHQPTAQPL